MSSSERPDRGSQPWGWFVALAAIALCGVLGTQARSSLGLVAVVCGTVQVVLAIVVIRGSPHAISWTSALAVTWLVTYTFRLAQITVAADPRYHHPTILAASDETKAWFWVLTTLAFAAFTVGTLLIRRRVKQVPAPDVQLPRHTVLALFYVFIGLSYFMAFTGLNSGFLQNISQFYLFTIAYASYESAKAHRSIGPELAVVGLASLLALTFGFKEFAILPVFAWLIGQWTARRRVLSAGAVVVVLIGAFFYVGIQAQRAADVLGEDRSFLTAFQRGLTEYDLVTGQYRHKEGRDIAYNVFSAVGARLTGVDALFLIDAKVPEFIPFQHGRSIVEPLLSTVPGMARFLSPDFRTLSLGRYATFNFWSLNPNYDESSQALTVVGDFWLNFATPGVLVGLFGFGLLYAFIDRRTGVTSATGAGIFAYAAIPMLAIERNVAYLLMTGTIRYLFALFMISQLRRLAGRQHEEKPPPVPVLTPVEA